jgi:hypothetical protein
MFHIERSKIDNIFQSMLWNVIKKVINSFSMRINERESFAIPQILYRHVPQHDRLPHTSLADDVHVAIAVFRFNAERNTFPTAVGSRKVCDAFGVFHRYLLYQNFIFYFARIDIPIIRTHTPNINRSRERNAIGKPENGTITVKRPRRINALGRDIY